MTGFETSLKEIKSQQVNVVTTHDKKMLRSPERRLLSLLKTDNKWLPLGSLRSPHDDLSGATTGSLGF